MPGGREELRERVDPRLRDMVDGISAVDAPPAASFVMRGLYTAAGEGVDIPNTVVRLRDRAGEHVGTALISKPAVGMAVLGTMAAGADTRHFERMQQVAKAARRPAAVLFADLEASSPLARRLSTASYFALGRRMARAADRCVIDAGGLVGRHVGDGVVRSFSLRRWARNPLLPVRASKRLATCATPWSRWPPEANCSPRTWSCASACTGGQRCMSGRSRPAGARR